MRTKHTYVENIAKGTTDPRVEKLEFCFNTKVTSLGHIKSPYANLQKFHLQNLDPYLIFVNFGTPPHYLGLYKVHQKVCKFATK